MFPIELIRQYSIFKLVNFTNVATVGIHYLAVPFGRYNSAHKVTMYLSCIVGLTLLCPDDCWPSIYCTKHYLYTVCITIFIAKIGRDYIANGNYLMFSIVLFILIVYLLWFGSVQLQQITFFLLIVWRLTKLFVFYRKFEYLGDIPHLVCWTVDTMGIILMIYLCVDFIVAVNSYSPVELLGGVSTFITITASLYFSNKSWKRYGLLKKKDHKNLYFIDFNEFVKYKSLIRNSTDSTLVRPVSLADIDRDQSILIFVSHGWVRPTPESVGWDGLPHPDDSSGSKYKLIVEGVKWILATMVKQDSTHCYIWIDFCCIDQDNRNSLDTSLKQYDKIIECCDAVFTPLPDVGRVDISNLKSNFWHGKSPQAYINRAWCRVEMTYAWGIPTVGNAVGSRYSLFDGELALAARSRMRPHIFCGYDLQPIVVSTRGRAFYTSYSPTDGMLSDESDREKIVQLMKTLQPYISVVDTPLLLVAYEKMIEYFHYYSKAMHPVVNIPDV